MNRYIPPSQLPYNQPKPSWRERRQQQRDEDRREREELRHAQDGLPAAISRLIRERSDELKIIDFCHERTDSEIRWKRGNSIHLRKKGMLTHDFTSRGIVIPNAHHTEWYKELQGFGSDDNTSGWQTTAQPVVITQNQKLYIPDVDNDKSGPIFVEPDRERDCIVVAGYVATEAYRYDQAVRLMQQISQ